MKDGIITLSIFLKKNEMEVETRKKVKIRELKERERKKKEMKQQNSNKIENPTTAGNHLWNPKPSIFTSSLNPCLSAWLALNISSEAPVDFHG